MASHKTSVLSVVSIMPSQLVIIPNVDHVRVIDGIAPAIKSHLADGGISFSPIMIFDASDIADLEKIRETLHKKVDRIFDEYIRILTTTPVPMSEGEAN